MQAIGADAWRGLGDISLDHVINRLAAAAGWDPRRLRRPEPQRSEEYPPGLSMGTAGQPCLVFGMRGEPGCARWSAPFGRPPWPSRRSRRAVGAQRLGVGRAVGFLAPGRAAWLQPARLGRVLAQGGRSVGPAASIRCGRRGSRSLVTISSGRRGPQS